MFFFVRERESEVLQITQVEPLLKMLKRGKSLKVIISKLDGTVLQLNHPAFSLHLGVSPFQIYCQEKNNCLVPLTSWELAGKR